MTKLKIITAVFIFIAFQLNAQSDITLRIGSVDSENLQPGAKVLVPVYCDKSEGIIMGWQFYIYFDDEVLTLKNVLNRNKKFTGEWIENTMESMWAANWYDENLKGTVLEAELMFEMEFEYLGGTTPVKWTSLGEKQSQGVIDGRTLVVDEKAEPYKAELIHGCVCSLREH